MKPVCLVIGAGAGIGGNVARRFAQEGYHACLCRRSDSDGLNRMVKAIKNDGGSVTGFLLNAIEANSIEERVAGIEADIGPIEVVVYNLGAQIGDRALKDTSLKAFETGWRLASHADRGDLPASRAPTPIHLDLRDRPAGVLRSSMVESLSNSRSNLRFLTHLPKAIWEQET